jgi:hypothetical protein
VSDIVKRTLDAILPLEERKLLLAAIGQGLGENPTELAEALDIDESIIVELMNDEEFYLEVCNYTQASAKLTYHIQGRKTLEHVLKYGENKESPGRLKAFDRLERMIGAGQPPVPPNIFAFGIEAALGQQPTEKVVKGVARRDTPAQEEEEVIELKPSLKKKPVRRYAPVQEEVEEEEVNGNIFEAVADDDEPIEDELEFLFRNSRELDLTK